MTAIKDELPLHSKDAEKNLLGSLLADRSLVVEAVTLVRADDFYIYAHARIFETIVALGDAGKDTDIVTVAEAIISHGLEQEIGGIEYLTELHRNYPSAVLIRQYAEIIRERAIARNLAHVGAEIIQMASDPTTPGSELLEQAERKIFDIAERGIVSEMMTVQDALAEMYSRWDARKDRTSTDVSGVPSGFIDLDTLLAGFQNSELSVIAARPSVGKTSLGLAIAINAIRQGYPTLFVSLEQAKAELAERMVCTMSKVDGHKIRKGWVNADEIERLMAAGSELSQMLLYIDDTPSQGMMRIAAHARRLKRRKNLALVIIDYIQLIDPDNRREPRQEQVAGISRRLKFLARDLKIPVICMAQLNRDSEKTNREPKLSDLRESGAIEQDADTVMLMWRPSAENLAEIEIIVGKNRNGPTGRFSLMYEKAYMRFENMAP